MKAHEIKVTHTPTGITRAFIPKLSNEERERRMKSIYNATAELLRAQENAR